MEWSRDLESGGGGFDSPLPEVTCWLGWGHFFVIFGMSWEVSGSGLGMFLDRFGMVLEKMSGGAPNTQFSKMIGVLSLSQAVLNSMFRLSPAKKYPKFGKMCFVVFLYIKL